MKTLTRLSPLTGVLRYWRILLAVIALIAALRYAYRYSRRILKLPSTESVLMALGAAAANWEMYTLADRKKGNSFSAVIRKLATAQPFIAVMYAMTGRHLFGGDPTTLAAYEAGWKAGEFWPLLDKEEMETTESK